MKPHILFYSNGLAICIWHSFHDIIHIKADKDPKLAILNLIELTFFRAYPSFNPFTTGARFQVLNAMAFST